MPDQYGIGVDLGGTKIMASVVNLKNGRLVSVAKKKTPQEKDRDALIKKMSAAVAEAISQSSVRFDDIQGIGIGAAGQVNREKGILVNAANLGLSNVNLCQPLSKEFELPCVIGNDVEAAALGETYFGSGKDSNNFVCVFVGTGIGGAIVYHGQLMHGASGSAGEIGHMVLYPYGRICGCGALGCLEAYASRTAITREILARLKRGHDSVIREQIKPEDTVIRSSVLADAVRLKDELAISVISQAAEFMGLGLASIMNFYNPERIILGGGVVEALDLYTNKAVQQAKLSSLKGPGKKTEFIRAALGDYAGVIGAATMVVNGRN